MSDNKSTTWSVTINNPIESDYTALDLARSRGWKCDGQVEVGEEGTPHLQLIVRTPHIRFGAVKKVFQRGHIEAARNPAALATYVKKEDTRVGSLPVENRFYPPMNRYFQLVVEWCIECYKDRLNVDAFLEGEVVLMRTDRTPTPDQLLNLLDAATSELVREGFHVEHYAVNPAVRSSWKKFGCEMLLRAHDEVLRLERTAAAAAARSEEEVDIPTVEHNHAISSPELQAEVQSPPPPPPCPTHGSSCGYYHA